MSNSIATALEISPSHDGRTRAHCLAQMLLRETNWDNFVRLACDFESSQSIEAANVHPASRDIASLFALMEPHQRPSRSSSPAALQIVERLVQTLLATITKASSASHGPLTNTLTRRVLAPLYFPNQSLTWKELLTEALNNSVDNYVLYVLNGFCDGELLSYLDTVISKELCIESTIQRDFNFSWQKLCSEVRLALATNHQSHVSSTTNGSYWPLVWDWVQKKSAVSIPAQLNCRHIDWESIYEIDCQIAKSLGNSKPSSSANAVTKSLSQDCATGIDTISEATKTPTLQANHSGDTKESKEPVASDRKGRMDSPASSSSNAVKSATRAVNESIDELDSFLNELNFQVYADNQPEQNGTKCSIRSATDPNLTNSLNEILSGCRSERGTLSLLQLRVVDATGTIYVTANTHDASQWHVQVFEEIRQGECGKAELAFVNAKGDLCVIISDLERTELVRFVRETLLPLDIAIATSERSSSRYGFVCGAATVSNPHRGFTIQQLIDGADRCVSGALVQGAGNIKSLDVY